MSYEMDPKNFSAMIAGALTHITIFIRGEWHLRAPAVVVAYITLAIFTWMVEIYACSESYVHHISATLVIISSYALGLFGSIVIYRMFFHRLRQFPGPTLAAVTKLWHVFRSRDSKNHLLLEALREEFGSFVRTGESCIYEALQGF